MTTPPWSDKIRKVQGSSSFDEVIRSFDEVIRSFAEAKTDEGFGDLSRESMSVFLQ
jgi:hypothetical protein